MNGKPGRRPTIFDKWLSTTKHMSKKQNKWLTDKMLLKIGNTILMNSNLSFHFKANHTKHIWHYSQEYTLLTQMINTVAKLWVETLRLLRYNRLLYKNNRLSQIRKHGNYRCRGVYIVEDPTQYRKQTKTISIFVTHKMQSNPRLLPQKTVNLIGTPEPITIFYLLWRY